MKRERPEDVVLAAIMMCGRKEQIRKDAAMSHVYAFLSGQPLMLIALGITEQIRQLGYELRPIEDKSNGET